MIHPIETHKYTLNTDLNFIYVSQLGGPKRWYRLYMERIIRVLSFFIMPTESPVPISGIADSNA